jgi:hypothetical protein
MKILHVTIIITSMFVLFLTSHAYAQCTTVNGVQQCLGMNTILTSIRSDHLVYQNSDRPVITITGMPNSPEYLQIYNQSENMVFSHSLELPSSGVTNYTLDISSYKPGLYSAIANTSTSKASTNFRVSQVPLSGPIVVFNVMNRTYAPGDSIAILGTDGPNGIIQISLVDPNDKTVSSIQVNSDNIGQFSSDALKIPINAVSGIWEINATHGVAQGSQTIKVISLNNTVSTMMSPLQQFKSGIEAKNVVCKQNFELIFKAEDGSPACVKPDTASILIGRGWAKALQ